MEAYLAAKVALDVVLLAYDIAKEARDVASARVFTARNDRLYAQDAVAADTAYATAIAALQTAETVAEAVYNAIWAAESTLLAAAREADETLVAAVA